MLISIGILAYNEADVIESTLASLFLQTVFQCKRPTSSDLSWEIVVVPNGCIDDTACRAEAALREQVAKLEGLNVVWRVDRIAEAGKSNAWNRYVHEFSSSDAELLVMLDADIEFGERETIENTLAALRNNPHAWVAVDLPLKDAVKKEKKTLLEKVSIAASKFAAEGRPGIAGSFYCARAEILRQIWMPQGLSGEDGFLRAMVVTNCFRSSVDDSRVIRATGASHYYETLTSLREIFRHELRLVIGTTFNCYLTWDLLYFSTDPRGPGAGVAIRNRMSTEPNWYPTLISNAIKNRGLWVLPRGMLFRRFNNVKLKHGTSNLKRILIAAVGFLFDLPVFVAANSKIKRGGAIGYW